MNGRCRTWKMASAARKPLMGGSVAGATKKSRKNVSSEDAADERRDDLVGREADAKSPMASDAAAEQQHAQVADQDVAHAHLAVHEDERRHVRVSARSARKASPARNLPSTTRTRGRARC